MKYHKNMEPEIVLSFFSSQVLAFDNIALGVDNPNKNNITTPCSVGLVDLFHQPSILRVNLHPSPTQPPILRNILTIF